ncbi:unnamed protein product [Eretmochelys imbricata]
MATFVSLYTAGRSHSPTAFIFIPLRLWGWGASAWVGGQGGCSEAFGFFSRQLFLGRLWSPGQCGDGVPGLVQPQVRTRVRSCRTSSSSQCQIPEGHGLLAHQAPPRQTLARCLPGADPLAQRIVQLLSQPDGVLESSLPLPGQRSQWGKDSWTPMKNGFFVGTGTPTGNIWFQFHSIPCTVLPTLLNSGGQDDPAEHSTLPCRPWLGPEDISPCPFVVLKPQCNLPEEKSSGPVEWGGWQVGNKEPFLRG